MKPVFIPNLSVPKKLRKDPTYMNTGIKVIAHFAKLKERYDFIHI